MSKTLAQQYADSIRAIQVENSKARRSHLDALFQTNYNKWKKYMITVSHVQSAGWLHVALTFMDASTFGYSTMEGRKNMTEFHNPNAVVAKIVPLGDDE